MPMHEAFADRPADTLAEAPHMRDALSYTLPDALLQPFCDAFALQDTLLDGAFSCREVCPDALVGPVGDAFGRDGDLESVRRGWVGRARRRCPSLLRLVHTRP